MGTSIEGWQVQSFESIIRKLHSPLMHMKTADNFQSINTQLTYIDFLIDNILERGLATEGEINVFMEVGSMGDDDASRENILIFYALLKQALGKRGLTGGAYIGVLSSLTLGSGGRLFLQSRCFHGVLIFSTEKEVISPAVFRSFMIDKVYLPDHLGTPMLEDKRNLVFLRVLALHGLSSSDENELILHLEPVT